jgi:hypothetical protein
MDRNIDYSIHVKGPVIMVPTSKNFYGLNTDTTQSISTQL